MHISVFTERWEDSKLWPRYYVDGKSEYYPFRDCTLGMPHRSMQIGARVSEVHGRLYARPVFTERWEESKLWPRYVIL
jgi:hypothetical protein